MTFQKKSAIALMVSATFVACAANAATTNRDCHEFCVHGIIGARYTGTPHEHNYQETNLS